MVTAAAVLAFVWGGLGIRFGLIAFAAGTVISSATNAVCSNSSLTADTAAACSSASGAGAFLITVTVATIIIAGLTIWGGVVTLNGKNGKILVIACGVYAALAVVSSFGFSYLLGFVIPVLIVVFMLNPGSKAWMKSRGGQTF